MLLSAIVLGFLGSLHCIGMCGPIAFMLPLDRDNSIKKLSQIITYHLGRLLSYGVLGLLFGVIGKGFFVSNFQQKLSIVVGALMIVVVLVPGKYLKKISAAKPLLMLLSIIRSTIGSRLKNKSYFSLLAIGVLNGFLPCGLIYIALFGAVAMGGPEKSAIYMLFFGLGTIPLMGGMSYLGNFLSMAMRKKINQLIPFCIMVIGFVFILRGLGLGIPYVSPSNINLMIKTTPNCIVY